MKKRAFTLIELLVVIAIIGVLAGLLIPVISKTRERARQTHCENNLKQIGLALNVYRQDFGNDQLPKWLTDLSPKYINAPKVFLCKSDLSDGAEGGRPENLPSGTGQFTSTDDPNKSSYMFEFCGNVLPSTEFDYYGYGITNGVAPTGATWKEVKNSQMLHGDDPNNNEPYAQTFFPMVRCFHHWQERQWTYTDSTGPHLEGLTINLAYAGNIFRSAFTWEVPLSEMTELP